LHKSILVKWRNSRHFLNQLVAGFEEKFLDDAELNSQTGVMRACRTAFEMFLAKIV
jgi:hypothetical protein